MLRGNGTHAVGGEGVPEGYLSNPSIRDRVNNQKDQLAERLRDMPETLTRANGTFVSFVREQPLVALGAACAFGYVLGRMLRRVV